MSWLGAGIITLGLLGVAWLAQYPLGAVRLYLHSKRRERELLKASAEAFFAGIEGQKSAQAAGTRNTKENHGR
jgi:hypothetical protein